MANAGERNWDLRIIRDIDAKEFEQIHADQKNLIEFLEGDLLPYVQFALAFYNSATSQALANQGSPDRRSIDGLALRYNALTFVAALCMHKEQTDTKIHRIRAKRWGKDFARGKGDLSSIYYDKSFAYRFCVRLRNFVLHEHANVVSSSITRSIESPEARLHVTINRDLLIGTSEKRRNWSSVADEIAALAEEIELTGIIREAANVAHQLAARARLLLFPGISQSVKRFRIWGREVGELPEGHLPCLILRESFGENQGAPESILSLDFTLAEKAAALIREARSAN